MTHRSVLPDLLSSCRTGSIADRFDSFNVRWTEG
jgi:hypothetical protein